MPHQKQQSRVRPGNLGHEWYVYPVEPVFVFVLVRERDETVVVAWNGNASSINSNSPATPVADFAGN